MEKRILGIILAMVIAGSIGVYWYWSTTLKRPLTLRFGHTPYADSAPLYVTVEKGFFEEENLNVSLTKFVSGTKILEAAAAGSLDGGFVWTIFALLAFEGGVDLKIAAGGSYVDKEHDTSSIVVRMNSPIRSIKDLKGKTTSTFALGAASLPWEVILQKHGMTLEDVNMVVIRSQPDTLEAIIAGRVDAAFISEPFLTPALETGKVQIIYRFWTEVFPDHRYQMATTFFLKSFIDEHKDAVDAFIRAYGKAVDWIDDHPQETREIIARWTGIDPELAKKMVLHAWSKELDSEGIKRIINLVVEHGVLKRDIEVEDMIYQG